MVLLGGEEITTLFSTQQEKVLPLKSMKAAAIIETYAAGARANF